MAKQEAPALNSAPIIINDDVDSALQGEAPPYTPTKPEDVDMLMRGLRYKDEFRTHRALRILSRVGLAPSLEHPWTPNELGRNETNYQGVDQEPLSPAEEELAHEFMEELYQFHLGKVKTFVPAGPFLRAWYLLDEKYGDRITNTYLVDAARNPDKALFATVVELGDQRIDQYFAHEGPNPPDTVDIFEKQYIYFLRFVQKRILRDYKDMTIGPKPPFFPDRAFLCYQSAYTRQHDIFANVAALAQRVGNEELYEITMTRMRELKEVAKEYEL
jgi:hypothetical protein